MSASRMIHNPSLIAYGVLSILLSIALFFAGSIMANPTYESIGYLVSEVFTGLCLVACSTFAAIMRSRTNSPRRMMVYAVGLAVPILCWILLWAVRPAEDSSQMLMVMVGLHGVFWSVWCVSIATDVEVVSLRSILLALMAAPACSAGILFATHSGTSKLGAVTAAALYMLCLGVQVLFVSFLLQRELSGQAVAEN